MNEKRKCSRLDINLPVTLRCRGLLIPATTLNISCGGACLAIESPIVEEHDSVEVIVDLDEGKKDVALCGEVIRKEESDEVTVGIKFTNLFTIGHKTLEMYIKTHLN